MGLTMISHCLVPLSSAEPGCEGSFGVAALIFRTLINTLHAVSAALLLITFVPKTLSEFDVSATGVFMD